jgi:hypothetical protein
MLEIFSWISAGRSKNLKAMMNLKLEVEFTQWKCGWVADASNN